MQGATVYDVPGHTQTHYLIRCKRARPRDTPSSGVYATEQWEGRVVLLRSTCLPGELTGLQYPGGDVDGAGADAGPGRGRGIEGTTHPQRTAPVPLMRLAQHSTAADLGRKD